MTLVRPFSLAAYAAFALAWSIGCESEPATPAPEATKPTPAKVPAPTPAKDEGPNPCDNRKPVELELPATKKVATPWGLEFVYSIGGERVANGPPEFLFSLMHGPARWETVRNPGNWNQRMTWHGFCWRPLGTPERRAHTVRIQVAPVCDENGKQTEFGGCRDALPE